MGTLFVDKLDPQSGTSLEIGSSGDTVAVNTGATTNLAGNVTLGASGKTITVPAGATITNSGTATGFGAAGTESFLAREASTQTVQDNVYTQVSFSTEVFDTGNNFASNTFTAPSNGKYYLFANVSIAGTSSVAMSHFVSLFYKNNGALDYFRTVYQDEALASVMIQQTLSAVIDLSANDTIKVYAKGNANNNTVRFIDKAFGGFKLT